MWNLLIIPLYAVILVGGAVAIAKIVEFMEVKYLHSVKGMNRFVLFFSCTFTVLIGLTLIVQYKTSWMYWEAHFTLGLLAVVFVFMMQYNRHIGERAANVDNRYFGSGSNIYKHDIFHLTLDPVFLATSVFAVVGVVVSLVIYL